MTANSPQLPGLANEVRSLRLALLDAEIAEANIAPRKATYRALCKRLLET